MFQYAFMRLSECANLAQFRDITNSMVQDDGWELFNVIGMHNDMVACFRKEVKISP